MAKYGFKSKSVLDRRGFLSAIYKVELKNGVIQKAEGRSFERNVKDNVELMREDSRYHAVSQVLYNGGYMVEKSNYEQLDIDKVENVTLIDYNFYYTENEFQSYGNVKRKYKTGTKSYIVQRDKRGRFVKFYNNNSRKSAKKFRSELDDRYKKKAFAKKFS